MENGGQKVFKNPNFIFSSNRTVVIILNVRQNFLLHAVGDQFTGGCE